MKKLLCLIGLHDWEYREGEAVRFFFRDIWPYKICKVCEKVVGTYKR